MNNGGFGMAINDKNIPKGWKKVKLGEVAEINMGQSPKSEFYNTEGKGLPFLQGNRTFGYRFPKIDTYCTNPIKIAKKGEILFSVRAPVGDINIANQDICIGRGLAALKAKNDNNIFLFYLLNYFKEEILNSEAGTVFGSINKNDLKNLEILLPPLEEQKAIASVLSSLDDKIDLLHRQNQTLEKMAETLFRKWFIEDAKEDWEEGTIGQLISVQSGFAFKSKDFKNNGIDHVIKIKNIKGGIINLEDTDFIDSKVAEKIGKQFQISSGDVLIAMTGAEIGKLGIVPNTNKKLWLNQRVGLLKEKYPFARFLAYLQLKSDYGQEHITNTAGGSAQPNISGEGIENCGFPKISEEQIISYSKQVGELYTKVIYNLGQIRTLEKLRDALLPKLMSGEIRIMNNE